MPDAGFLAGLAGLALLDAVVTSTLYITIAIILLARRPIPTSISYAVGQLGSFFLLSLGLYFGSAFMAETLDSFTLWTRRLILVAAIIFFIVLGIRRFRSRPRHGLHLPTWVNPWTALPFGVVVMLFDLPFSFPMFLSVERLVDAGVGSETAVPILVAYTIVSSLPTVLLILVGIISGDRARQVLEKLVGRFSTGYTRPSRLIAGLHFTVAAGAAYLLFFVLG